MWVGYCSVRILWRILCGTGGTVCGSGRRFAVPAMRTTVTYLQVPCPRTWAPPANEADRKPQLSSTVEKASRLMAATCATANNDSGIGQAVPRTVKQHWYCFIQFVSDHRWETHKRLYTVLYMCTLCVQYIPY